MKNVRLIIFQRDIDVFEVRPQNSLEICNILK